MFGQASGYRLIRAAPRVVFAGAARIGLATGFVREVETPPGSGLVASLRELPASERFFAGGSTTVRGFAQDKPGAPGTISDQDFPLGGNAVIIMNAEVRARLIGALDGAAFLDAGNVFENAFDIDFGEIRASVGFGLRYQSPIGPIRVDLGFAVAPRDPVRASRGSDGVSPFDRAGILTLLPILAAAMALTLAVSPVEIIDRVLAVVNGVILIPNRRLRRDGVRAGRPAAVGIRGSIRSRPR